MLYKNKKKIVYFRKNDRKYDSKKEKVLKIIQKLFIKVKYEKIDNGIILIIPEYKKYGKIKKNIIIKQIKRIKELKDADYAVYDKDLTGFYSQLNLLKTLDGKLLMKSLIIKILEYIFIANKSNINLENVYIFANTYNKSNIYLIEKLISKFKTVNIITENVRYYRRLEERLYEQGVLITVSSNKRKSARNAKYIINLDFSANDFHKYFINNRAIIINTTYDELILEKNFNGVVVNNFELSADKDIKEFISEYYGNFNVKILLESVLINLLDDYDYIDRFYNEKTLEIKSLTGKRGMLNNSEFLL